MGKAESHPEQRSPYADISAYALLAAMIVSLFVCAIMWGGMLRH